MATIGTAAQTGGAAPAGGPDETEALTRQLDEHGYALLPDVLPPEKVARYRRRILELSAAEPEHGRTQQHVRWLMNKGAEAAPDPYGLPPAGQARAPRTAPLRAGRPPLPPRCGVRLRSVNAWSSSRARRLALPVAGIVLY